MDTNVLVRLSDPRDSLHTVAGSAVRKMIAAGDDLFTTTQNHIELWVVATRPAAKNGLGMSPADAVLLLQTLGRLYPRLPDPDGDGIYPHWLHLVATVGVSGKQAHDTRLVAAMLAHGLTHILTFNVGDFTRFVGPAGVTVVDPNTV